jgi:flagellar biosynthetic protein FliR
MLQEITTDFIYQFMLIFARLGVAFSMFPGFGENTILMRGRLIFALSVSLILLPTLASVIPKYTENAALTIGFIAIEMIIGLLISIASKFYFWSMHATGQIIAMQSGLGAASFFDPSQGMQSAVFTTFLFLLAVTLIFVSDTHYLFINAIIESYERFPAGNLPEIADMSKFIIHITNDSFLLAFKLSSPFLVISVAILVGSGILARLMPNLQVFFVITPAQILVIFGIFYIVVNAIVNRVVETIAMSVNISGF